MGWILDLDGVVWRGTKPVDGAAEAVERLRGRGERILFVTNNSYFTVAEQEARLAEQGIAAEGDVVTSAMAAAALVDVGSTALVCGGPGIEEALRARGVKTVQEGRADAVVVGWHREFDYERLTVAYRAVAAGARLLATNDDATYPMPEGSIPGGGAIVAAVATAAGVAPVVAGKPHPPMAELVRSLVPGPGTVVGDRPETDGLFARNTGMRFVLVLTGVTTREDLPVEPRPDAVADDLLTLVERELG